VTNRALLKYIDRKGDETPDEILREQGLRALARMIVRLHMKKKGYSDSDEQDSGCDNK